MSKPTDSELIILHLLWEKGPSTVREINDALNDLPAAQRSSRRESGEVGYTTTLKLMQIMYEKGLLEREEDGRTHRYTALVSEQDTKEVLLQNFMETTFRGSAMDLVLQALGGHDANPDELEKIKALIAEMEQKQGK
jgi:predicted transcriptional regulator